MHRRLLAIVTTWPFVASLLVLLANDLWLKQAMPGLVTGKLSDFAGIAVVAMLLGAAWPQRPVRIGVALALGFACWKSPLSQPLIDALNLHLPVRVGRVIDMTDLVALCVIPSCHAVASDPMRHAIPGTAMRRVLVMPVMVLTTLGLMGTSVIPVRHQYEIRTLGTTSDFDRKAVAATIAEVARLHGLSCEDCTDPTAQAFYRGKDTWLRYRFVGERAIAFDASAWPSSVFSSYSTAREKAERLRGDVKFRLARDHGNLEYFERLESHPRPTP